MCVRILPLLFPEQSLIEAVSETVRHTFNMPVSVESENFGLDDGHDPIRNQTNSNWILKEMLARYPDNGSKILGLTDRDLFSPVLTYVFGEAELGGRAAVVSTHRFHSELYGLPVSGDLVQSRLIREVVHELGHTFGLIHCRYQGCVMYPSSYVEEIDMKPDSFCSSCVRMLEVSRTTRPT